MPPCVFSVPPEASTVRVTMMFTMLPGALAIHEQRQLADLPQLHTSFDALVADLIDIGVGALQAEHTTTNGGRDE